MSVPRADRGFTTVELLVAMGIFSTLMVIVGAATLALFGSINTASRESTLQTESQNAMEYVSRLIRYADAPDSVHNVMPDATTTSVSVYSYPGLSTIVDVPVLVKVATETQPDGGLAVVSDVWSPVRAGSAWSWETTPVRRTLLRLPASIAGSPLSFRYFACTPSEGCEDTLREVTPNPSGPLTLGALEVPESVIVAIGNPRKPGSQITQAVKLVNQS